MALVVILSRVLGRESDALRVLVLAGGMMVLVNPMILLHDVSFQLSFAATLAIVALVPVIEKHFLKDIKGNLKKYSTQQFRCVKCNEKFRRPPLSNKCLVCGNKLLFTISEGSVIKYLEPSLKLARKYDFSPYLKQSLEVVEDNILLVFGKDKDKQVGLGTFLNQS